MQLLLVEDDAVISRELCLHWQACGWNVLPAGTLAAAMKALAAYHPDVIVLDLQLPDGDGLRWLESFRRRDSRTPVLVLTARDRVVDRVEGLKRGADDYLVKPFAAAEIDARIEALHRRARTTDGQCLQFATLTVYPEEGRVLLDGAPLVLARRELEVLCVLLSRSPRVATKSAIATALAERNIEIGEAAVEVYVSRLRRKLAPAGIGIENLRAVGYQLQLLPTGAAMEFK
jgi:DNA-binding response OmpR family regulator